MFDTENDKKIKAEFFAAANSGRGFVSFYGKIFGRENIKRRYLIKGGPGTGKSTFMKKVAEAAEGCGMSVERYRCSSDPNSLDGVIINKNVAVIDSTAPHAEEVEIAGARDVLVDLGAFWNSDGLYAESDKIKKLMAQKKHSYALAYRFLASAMECDIASREFVMPYVDKKRLARLVKRLTRNISADDRFECRIGLSKAIGMTGRCSLDAYTSLAQKTVYIEEHYGIGYLVLCELCEEARRKGCKISVSYEPLSPDFPDLVFFEESKTLFLISPPKTHGAISLRRLLDISIFSKIEKNKLKAKSRNAKRLSEALILAATDELKTAGEAHFELEKIYRSNMDFAALDAYTSRLTEQIINFTKGW